MSLLACRSRVSGIFGSRACWLRMRGPDVRMERMKPLVAHFTRLLMVYCLLGLAGSVHAQPLLTSSAGFRILVTAGSSSDAIMRNRGIADQVAPPTAGMFRVVVPVDAFAHTNPNAVITLMATQSSGEQLPAWASFESVTGRFTFRVAPGERRTLNIKVVARDDGGRSTYTTFLVMVGTPYR